MPEMSTLAAKLKRVLPEPAWTPCRRLATGLIAPIRFARATGHWRSSLRGRAIDHEGKAIPWYTYPAVDFLAQRDFTGKRILEMGGGQSTIWWAERAAEVVCIEQDREWHAELSRRVPANVELHHFAVEDKEGVSTLLERRGGRYDLIIIDDYDRPPALLQTRPYLADGGALIFDNSEGYGFQEETANWPFNRVDFYGFQAGAVLRGCTSILFGNDCFLFDSKLPIAAIT